MEKRNRVLSKGHPLGGRLSTIWTMNDYREMSSWCVDRPKTIRGRGISLLMLLIAVDDGAVDSKVGCECERLGKRDQFYSLGG